MVKGWKQIGGKWYLFKGGVMQTGWKNIGGKWYFFKGGVMQTGWKKQNGNWYYFDSEGVMVTGTKKIGGINYTFSSEGICLNPSGTSAKGVDFESIGVYSFTYSSSTDWDTYINGPVEGDDCLCTSKDGTFSGDFYDENKGTGCKYKGKFTSLKTISKTKEGNVTKAKYSMVLSEFTQEYTSGTSYRNSSGKTVRAVSHPVLEPGKTYYVLYESSPYYLYYWLLDENGEQTGYGYIAGQA